MSKQKPRRLGRGLEGLIGNGLQKPTPPAISIDRTRVEVNASPAKDAPVQPPVAKAKPEELIEDLNDLLKKTQAEAEGAETFSAAEAQAEAPATSQEDKASQDNSAQGSFALIDITRVKVSPFQRRKDFSVETIRELAASIRAEGLLQPIVVRALPKGDYELIAGERRLRACQSLSMERVPARLVNVADKSAAVMGLIENLQRENLNPVDEARGYGMLLTDFHMTQDAIAEATGKARATIANSLRLLLLEVEILGYLAKGQISTGHAKVLLSLPEGPQRVLVARKIIEDGLSVRATEALLRNNPSQNTKTSPKRVASAEEVAAIADLQKRLVGHFNTKVALQHSAKGGKVVIAYRSNAELDGILKRMGVQ